MTRLDATVPRDRRPGLEALSLLSKKWHPIVLVVLAADGPCGFSELGDRIPDVSGKVLTDALDSLREAGLVERREVSESPLRVEYDLTEAGRDMGQVFDAASDWAERHLEGTDPRVLLADADHRLTDLYGGWLDDRYAVVRCHGAGAFAERVDEGVDVVILDAALPGIEVDAAVSGLPESCRSVLLVGDRPPVELLDVPCDDILRKPVVRDALLGAVESQLSNRDASDRQRTVSALRARITSFESVYPRDRLDATDVYRRCRETLDDLADEREE
ncbi:winged helix-turn-helix transcriptional regulator [Halovivax cerinus]|uniref:Winged helix-turn-helix transcriptional regulator n=1 Tax=Halovivax cerinus TaxID=1487865 RepID=A0ABD5NQ52_9EURY|nr:winged helix-turn-helix transcriptional regulator [Halovivax cerinus]